MTGTDRRTDVAPRKGEVPAAARDAAAGIVAGMDLARVSARPSQRRQLADAVAVVLAAGYAVDVVTRYLTAKVREARTARYVLSAFDPERWDDIEAIGQPPHLDRPTVTTLRPCGQCDARDDDPISARVVWLDADRTSSIRCPRCHPAAMKTAL